MYSLASMPEETGDLQKDYKALRSDLFQLKEYLRWFMEHIDTSNMTEEAVNHITEPVLVKVKDVEEGLESKVKIAKDGIEAVVSAVGEDGEVTAASIVEAIKDAGSTVKISADNIDLSGVTTFMKTSDYSTYNANTTKIDGGNVTMENLKVRKIYGLYSDSASVAVDNTGLTANDNAGNQLMNVNKVDIENIGSSMAQLTLGNVAVMSAGTSSSYTGNTAYFNSNIIADGTLDVQGTMTVTSPDNCSGLSINRNFRNNSQHCGDLIGLVGGDMQVEADGTLILVGSSVSVQVHSGGSFSIYDQASNNSWTFNANTGKFT